MLETTKVQSSESNISIEKNEVMINTKKNDAKFNFLIVQVSEVVYELHINFQKG